MNIPRPAARWLVPLAVGGALWLVPTPDGLTPNAWRYVALFAFVITGLVTEPLPGAAMGLIGVSAAAALVLVGSTPAESMRWALSGFSNDVVWLIFSATTFALGYEVTGLGRRMALLLVRALGRRTLGLGYGIALADLVLAPFTPSNTARSAGTIFRWSAHPPLYGSSPTHNPPSAATVLDGLRHDVRHQLQFLTGMAPNLLRRRWRGRSSA